MQSYKVQIDQIQSNLDNPRILKEDKFKKLVNSVKDFPQMLKLRPIVVDENNIILGGNMRYEALKHIGVKEVDVIKAENLTEEQKKEFIIKDNVGFGEWDWNILSNEWETNKLNEWGLETWQTENLQDLDNFFKEEKKEEETLSEENTELNKKVEWYDLFVDYVQKVNSNLYNEACEYADKNN